MSIADRYTWDTPTFVDPPTHKLGGVDYLGLRQVNLDMMANCIPGVNNNTWHIRGFSVLSWICWRFERELLKAKIVETDRTQFLYFQEKAETLFTWGHQLASIRGTPGGDAKCPEPAGPSPLDFKSWHRNISSTSLGAAVQYGPALKGRVGYGFAEVVKGITKATPRGAVLAEALQKRLEKAGPYNLLVDLDRRVARPRDAEALLSAWRVDDPSRSERQAFRDAFFDRGSIGKDTAIGRRSSLIAATQELLIAAKRPLGYDEIRQCLARLHTPSGKRLRLGAAEELSCRRWLVLQIRQAQRAGLEGVLSWFEGELLARNGRASRTDISAAITARFAEDDVPKPWRNSGISAISDLGLRGELDYHRDCCHNEEGCFFSRTQKLLHAAAKERSKLLVESCKLLLVVIRMTQWLSSDSRIRADLSSGGVERVSLDHLVCIFAELETRPVAVWVDAVLDRCVIPQHQRFATIRFDGRRQRLRFGPGEFGLECYDTRPSQPNFSVDHLPAALSLMAECDLIAYDEEADAYISASAS